ncbi:MAG: carbamate kinase [Gemmatimonadota bacterium]
MRVVIALGGNAVLRRGEDPTAGTQRRTLAGAVAPVAALARQHQLVITHGNGPQVGLLAMQRSGRDVSSPYPLDILVAETQGMLGYMIAEQLRDELPHRDIATLLTQVEVDPGDPAWSRPTKPIGQVYTEAEAREIGERRGWDMAPERGPNGDGWRRVVASPRPRRILDPGSLRVLLDHESVVVCGGGGGIPVVRDERGRIRGVEAVVDKDLTAALLARELGADALLLLTDVDGIYRDWGGPSEELITRITPSELEALDLPVGSMGPKAEACVHFVESTGHFAAVGRLERALEVLGGRSGTRVEPA